MNKSIIALVGICLSIIGCSLSAEPRIVVVTSQPQPSANNVPTTTDTEAEIVRELPLSPQPQAPLSIPSPNPTRPVNDGASLEDYVVQPGDTLSGIARTLGVNVDTLIEANELLNPDVLSVGQVLSLPDLPTELTPSFKILPDSRTVRGPGSDGFDVFAFVAEQPGYVRVAVDEIDNDVFTAAQVINRVALEYSVDPRLLLILLEYRSGWLSNPSPTEAQQTYAVGAQASPLGFDRDGLYRQLTWAANELNRGYYSWKYRGLTSIAFDEGTRLLYAPELNAGTVGLQYLLSQFNTYAQWQRDVSLEGFYSTYVTYFGDPFADAVEPLVPANIEQPALVFPFLEGETWFYTGGPHGGWGSGSAWSAVDFAPPDDRPDGSAPCYISQFFTTAVAPGVIARSGDGSVILDLDGDGDETTGWTILYLHIATLDRIEVGTRVTIGDNIGRPSCEGGFSNATHLHIARRYNGEWLPAYCHNCTPEYTAPAFVMSDWSIVGYLNQEYQGYMTNNGERRNAEQGRIDPLNRISR